MDDDQLVRGAFVALGEGATLSEIEIVAKVVRANASPETLARFDYEDNPGPYHELIKIAEENGSNGHTLLDLAVETLNPGGVRHAFARYLRRRLERPWLRLAR